MVFAAGAGECEFGSEGMSGKTTQKQIINLLRFAPQVPDRISGPRCRPQTFVCPSNPERPSAVSSGWCATAERQKTNLPGMVGVVNRHAEQLLSEWLVTGIRYPGEGGLRRVSRGTHETSVIFVEQS